MQECIDEHSVGLLRILVLRSRCSGVLQVFQGGLWNANTFFSRAPPGVERDRHIHIVVERGEENSFHQVELADLDRRIECAEVYVVHCTAIMPHLNQQKEAWAGCGEGGAWMWVWGGCARL